MVEPRKRQNPIWFQVSAKGIKGREEKRPGKFRGRFFTMKASHPAPEAILDEGDVLACPNCFIYRECERVHLTQREPGINYVLQKGMPRKGSSLAKRSVHT